MHPVREPILEPVPVRNLRPTQMTVGMREVEARRKRWRSIKAKDGGAYLGRHMIPVVLGPKNRRYVIDHHHLARALMDEGIEEVLVTVAADLSRLPQSAFWVVLDNRGWMHPFDENGKRRDYDDIPKSIGALADDPFRSLAGALRRAGGFSKETTPFSEFLWADFLRRRMKRSHVKRDFKKSLGTALRMAKQKDAEYLPGWCGPSAED